MIKERHMSMDSLKAVAGVIVVSFLLSPAPALSEGASPNLMISVPQVDSLEAESGGCFQGEGMKTPDSGCVATGQLLVAESQVQAPIFQLSTKSRPQGLASGSQQPEPSGPGSASGWIVVLLIALVGVVTIPRRGFHQIGRRSPSKTREIVLHT